MELTLPPSLTPLITPVLILSPSLPPDTTWVCSHLSHLPPPPPTPSRPRRRPPLRGCSPSPRTPPAPGYPRPSLTRASGIGPVHSCHPSCLCAAGVGSTEVWQSVKCGGRWVRPGDLSWVRQWPALIICPTRTDRVKHQVCVCVHMSCPE